MKFILKLQKNPRERLKRNTLLNSESKNISYFWVSNINLLFFNSAGQETHCDLTQGTAHTSQWSSEGNPAH